MALAELIATLETEARAQVRAILAEGETRAHAIDAAAQRARSERDANARREWETELQTAADREIAATSQRMRSEVLVARQAMLDRVRVEVHALLPAMLDEKVGRVLVDAALECASGSGVLRCPPHILEHVGAPPTLRVEPDASITGAEIELATGTRIVATLAALFEREWPKLAGVALREVSP